MTEGAHNGTGTSRAGARAVKAKRATQASLILDYIMLSGGAACEQIEDALRLSHQTVSARLNGLKEADCAVDSGRRYLSRKGVEQVVWIATGKPYEAPPQHIGKPEPDVIERALRIIDPIVRDYSDEDVQTLLRWLWDETTRKPRANQPAAQTLVVQAEDLLNG